MNTEITYQSLDESRKNLWFDAARWFASMPVDAAITKLLERLGILFNADRVWLAMLNHDHTLTQVTHEWDAPGMGQTAGRRSVQRVPVYHWIYRRMNAGKEVMFDVDEIPKRYDGFRQHLIKQGVQSFYGIPLFVNNVHVGAIGYHKITRKYKWSHSERSESRKAAAIIGEWLQMKESHANPASLHPPSDSSSLFVKVGNESISLSTAKIVYIEAALNYSKIYISNENPTVVYRSMDEWETKLPTDKFIRIHRSYIVNTSKILKLNRNGGAWKITLTDQTPLPVGRNYRLKLLEKMGQ